MMLLTGDFNYNVINLYLEDKMKIDLGELAKCYRKILGTYHQSLDVFVFTRNKKFLGNICFRKECPARSIDCGVPGCGKIKYIRRFPNLNFNENDISKLEYKVLGVNLKHQSDFSFSIKS